MACMISLQGANLSDINNLMESAKLSEKIQFQDYSITVTQHSEQKISLHILRKTTGEVFEEKALPLTRLNYQAVLDGLKGTRKELKADIGEINCDGISVLEVRIHFQHSLLPSFTELMSCKRIKQLNSLELMKNELGSFPAKMQDIRNKISTMKKKMFVGYQKQREIQCRSASEQTIVSVRLDAGKYFITVSYMAKVTNQWIYVHLAQYRTKFIDQLGYYLPPESNSNFNPAILRCTLSVASDNYDLNFSVSNGNSYPATIVGAIITAQLLDEKE